MNTLKEIIDDRIFIYLDASLADFYVEISVPQKQCTPRWRLPRASPVHGAFTDQSQIVQYVVAFAVDKVF